ncbi:tetratricopeptide repeat protein [Methanobrevibacter sp.]|uniref:tetratricopeptide repeat protein n=1 Tax=Methanobrevibacter sp. TaxID=66852 RepID=UPI003890ED96
MKDNDWEDVDVNQRKTDRVYFESSLLQNISDSIDFLKDEASVILRDLDSTEFKQKIDEIDLEEFSEQAINQIDDVFDEISQFKDQVINKDDLPEEIKEFSKNTKAYLNRDEVYIRKARRKLEKEDSYRSNRRVVELCDKAIDVYSPNPEAHYLKARALINLKRYDDAIEEFISVLAIHEDDIDARLGIAEANRLSGEFDDAIDVYDSVLKVDEASAEALLGKALTYCGMEDYQKADEFFIKADALMDLDGNTMDIWDMCKEKM